MIAVLRTPGTAAALEHVAEPVASDGRLVVDVLAVGPVDLMRMYEGAPPCVPAGREPETV